MLIAHDPGHGCPPRPTGTSHGGLVERDWVLSMARDLAAAVPWCKHLLLRSGPSGPTYPERAARAESAGADLVLCHHVNAAADPSLDGLMCFVPPGSHIAREVGEAIMRAAPAELRRTKPKPIPSGPGDWTADAWAVMLHYHQRGLPVVLIEWGFATSPVDLAVLMAPSSRPALCAAGAAGIARAVDLTHGADAALALGSPLPDRDPGV